jgi:FkbM family methyltransferase
MLERVPGLRLVAFEPQRDLAESVRANLEALCPGRYEVNAVALGDEPGESNLVIPLDNRGGASLHSGEAGARARRERVEIVTAEQAVKSSRFGWPQLVKIDVEGHEPAVIRSLLAPLRAMTPKAVVFEHHGGQDATFSEMFRQLVGCGYGVFAIEKSLVATTLRPLASARSRATDFVAIRGTIIDPRHESTIGLEELRRAVAIEASATLV